MAKEGHPVQGMRAKIKYTAPRYSVKHSTKVPAAKSRRNRDVIRAVSTRQLDGYADGNLIVRGWEVRRKVWSSTHLKSARATVQSGVAGEGPLLARYRLQDDPCRAGIPYRMLFPGGSVRGKPIADKPVDYTADILLTLGRDISEMKPHNGAVIVVRSGAREQKAHVDTTKKDGLGLLHALTRRYIEVEDQFGWQTIRLNAGDVLLLRGGTVHRGVQHLCAQSSYIVHIPVGYNNINITAINED